MKSEAKNSFLLKPLVRALMTVRGKPAGFGLLATLPALAMAQTLPTGGQVVAGNANISQPNAGIMVINQSSDKSIINWQGFSIGANGYVQFVMPGAGSIALNRVVGQDPSSILGHLSSNGQVFLVNPNGVYFGANATVDVAGIVASTMNIRNEDFMRGDFRFKRDPNAPANATVINAGSINANGGYVVLAGDYVSNTGLIQAQLGSVMLASGNALTLQMAGSSLVNYAIDEATLAQLAGVSNAGQILAAGGKVVMTAEVANQLAGTVVNNSGLVQAQGTVEKDGAIYLTGKGGDVVNRGTLDASGGQNGKAGSVQMVASGDLVHEAGSLITVDGAQQGVSNGGSVTTWADGKNRFKEGATITARGGAEGGDGGFVELSGNSVAYRGKVDLLAGKGRGGTLLIDPTNITIKNGSGFDDDLDPDLATFYETNLEQALAGSGQVVLQAQNSGAGKTASIVVEDLADNQLTGSGTAGLTLQVSATNGATGSITFQDKNDRISVGGQLNLSVDDGANNALPFSSIDVGHLQSRTGIDLKAGSISANSLTVQSATNSSTDASYGIVARATTGDLRVAGDVRVEATNSQAAAVSTTVDLKADSGAVRIDGDVVSNATGLGYYHYNWVTGGNAATTYFGNQPWSIASQGDHAISTSLSIVSGANSDIVIGGGVQALATDNNTAFTANGVGGYWQTATATTHNFWRPTAASAAATITAGGNVNIGGNTAVKADGYATSAYSELESWRTMVDNFNFTTGTQTVYTNYGCLTNDVPCSGGTGYRDSYLYTDNRLKGSATGNYIWQFGSYTYNLPASSYNSPTVYTTTDYITGSALAPMNYTGARGLTAKLDVSAGKSVTMGGLDVRATNRSANGASSYTDVNWGHQDTAANLNNTASSFTSSNRETDYYDSFSTAYSAASTDAQASIVAGAGSAITINGGGANVVASNTVQGANSSIDFAKLSLTAGSGAGVNTGAIQLSSPVLVQGASDRSIELIVQNRDGAINQDANANISVVNQYAAGDASASLVSDKAAATLGAVSVSAGRAASLTAKGDSNLDSGNLAATGSTTATITAQATQGKLNAHGTLSATAATSSITMNSGTDMVTDGAINATANSPTGSATVAMTAVGALTTNALVQAKALQSQSQGFYPFYNVVGGAASVSLNSSGDMTMNGDVTATAYRNASVAIGSQQGAVTLAAGKSVTSQATGVGYDPAFYSYSYASTLNVSASSGMTLDGSLTSSAQNGTASMNIKTLGGAEAGITQGANSVAAVNGRTANLSIKAGNVQASTPDMASAQLNGALNVTASQGDAQLQLQAGSGKVNNFNVSATAAKGSASLSALKGDLAITGTNSVSGNSNASDGARLTVNSSGVLQADAATINVSNNNSGSLSAASASFSAGSTPEASSTLGTVTVSNSNNASLTASAAGPLKVSGALSTSASGINGVAQTTLSSTQDALEITDTGSVKARAVGTGGNATTRLAAVTGLTVNGNLLADAGNQGTLNVTSTGGTDAAINQGTTSEMKAAGITATLNINAGDAMPTAQNAAAIALAGALKAQASSGAAAITVNGKSGSMHDVSVTSLSNSAALQAQALNGDLSLDGTVGLSGNTNSSTGATLGLSASGALDTSAASITVANNSLGSQAGALGTLNAGTAMSLGAFNLGANWNATLNASAVDLTAAGDVATIAYATTGVAQTNLTASDGGLNVNAGKTVSSSSAGNASTTLVARNGMQINGDLSAGATAGTATISLTTTGGVNAGINQGSASHIVADGAAGTVSVLAGSATPAQDSAAGVSLAGLLKAHAGNGLAKVDVQAASGSLSNVQALSDNSNAQINVQANDANGSLSLNGTLQAQGNNNGNLGALLSVGSTGSIDASAATVNVGNLSTGSEALAKVSMTTSGGDLSTGAMTVGGRNAQIELRALGHLLTQGDITLTGVASAGLTMQSGGTLDLQSDLHLSATHGEAVANLSTTVNSSADIVQGANRNLLIEGNTARALMAANGGKLNLGGNTTVNAVGDGGIFAGGTAVELNNFAVTSTSGKATASFSSGVGDIVLKGAGTLTGAGNAYDGANLTLSSQGSIDTRLGTINVSNAGSGAAASAQIVMTARNGGIQSGVISASTAGEGLSRIGMQARQAVALNGGISAASAGAGAASVQILSGVSNTINVMAFVPTPQVQLTGNITQLAGTTIKANSNSGDAAVDLQAGNCCNGSIALAGTVEAKVAAGAGNASIAMRGTQITANQLRANTGLTGTGAANISLIASDTININGVVDLQARNRDARADLKLVADKLNWSGASTLSDNNVHIQLAPFSPDRLIGVDSDQDFDATVQTNYSQAMLKNFMGHGAEVTFGGVVDRSAFTWSSLKNLVQQSADIHVAANGPLNLGDVKMVFDTTGTTYYHDPRMSPWSVPTGRVAVFVARPNVDRYLDRTENTLQNMTRTLENSNPGTGTTPTVTPVGSGPVSGTTHVSGNLYMAGNGVNMDSAAESGKGEGTGPAGQSGKPTAGNQPEQDRDRQAGSGQAG